MLSILDETMNMKQYNVYETMNMKRILRRTLNPNRKWINIHASGVEIHLNREILRSCPFAPPQLLLLLLYLPSLGLSFEVCLVQPLGIWPLLWLN